MTSKILYIDQGWQPVAIGFCPDEAAWEREMRKTQSDAMWPGKKNAAAHTHIFHDPNTGGAQILVTVHPGGETDALTVILAIVHEAVHVWQFICEHIGEQGAGVEMEAYGIQHITNGLIKAYCESRGKGRDWLK